MTQPRGVKWGGGGREFKGGNIHISVALIHVDVVKTNKDIVKQYCKAKIKNKFKKKKKMLKNELLSFPHFS